MNTDSKDDEDDNRQQWRVYSDDNTSQDSLGKVS
jgi:hypothetical protein